MSAAKPELNPTSQVLSLDLLACSSWGLLYRQGEQKAARWGENCQVTVCLSHSGFLHGDQTRGFLKALVPRPRRGSPGNVDNA